MYEQEIKQLKDLNSRLIDKIHRYEDNESNILDKHLEYEKIQEGFDKI